MARVVEGRNWRWLPISGLPRPGQGSLRVAMAAQPVNTQSWIDLKGHNAARQSHTHETRPFSINHLLSKVTLLTFDLLYY